MQGLTPEVLWRRCFIVTIYYTASTAPPLPIENGGPREQPAPVMDIRWQLIEYIRSAVMSAKGNVVSFSLKQIKRALGMESKAE